MCLSQGEFDESHTPQSELASVGVLAEPVKGGGSVWRRFRSRAPVPGAGCRVPGAGCLGAGCPGNELAEKSVKA